jgi:PIN domain nuclease of toxin-antitoxin system
MMVFDSSALLAWQFQEEGRGFVEELLSEADVPMYLHAANEAEVLCKVAQRVDLMAARVALRSIQAMGVRTLHDMDAAFIEDVAALKADWNVALGDCFGVALTRRLGADFITADRGEMGKIKAAGVCAVTFIR